MNGDLVGPYPQLFLVDAAGGQRLPRHPYPVGTDPALVPCWTFPPARASLQNRRRGGVGRSLAAIVVMMLLVVVAALVLGAYQIRRLQMELEALKREVNIQNANAAHEKLVASEDDHHNSELWPAAHLVGKVSGPMSWEPRHGRAFTQGIVYRDHGLHINHTGLYFVYSRIEFQGNKCSPQDSLRHTVFAKGKDRRPRTLLEGQHVSFCRPSDRHGHVWTSDSFLSAILQLEEDEQVYVNASKPELLNKQNPNGNFFGLYRVS
uniref:THD domain-containing protein n=1 Tax=Denticeps clupeoides TaxID=299321 RepID=A0AAY4CYK8_9TELE